MTTYKTDWQEATERMAAFWRGEIRDRAPLWVRAPRRHPLPGPEEPRTPSDPAQLWTDMDYILRRLDYRLRTTCYLGEALPVFLPNLGPGVLALYLGCPPTFAEDTVWYNPILSDLRSGPDLSMPAGNIYRRWMAEIIARARREVPGEYMISFTDIIENLDILASLRGTQDLLVELLEDPAGVHRYQRQILPAFFAAYDELAGLQNVRSMGSIFAGFPVWMPGRGAKLQCDFSAMISPGMYNEFVLPYLRKQCQGLDQSFYHLDGPGALQHLDALLSIPELGGIQWTPGDGREGLESERWLPIYRRVQAAGKINFLLGVPAGAALQVAAKLDRQFTYISVDCGTQDEAEALLRAWK